MKHKINTHPCSEKTNVLIDSSKNWVSIPFSRGSSWPRDQNRISYIAGRFFTMCATREAPSRRAYLSMLPHPWGLTTTSFHLGFQWLRSKGRQSQFLLLPSVWLVESKDRKHQLWGLILNMKRNRVPTDGAPLSQKGTCSESYSATSL